MAQRMFLCRCSGCGNEFRISQALHDAAFAEGDYAGGLWCPLGCQRESLSDGTLVTTVTVIYGSTGR